jgi:hypothetical protein
MTGCKLAQRKSGSIVIMSNQWWVRENSETQKVLLTLLETTTLTNRALSLGLKEFNTASRDGKVEMFHLAITYLTNLQTTVHSMLSTSLTYHTLIFHSPFSCPSLISVLMSEGLSPLILLFSQPSPVQKSCPFQTMDTDKPVLPLFQCTPR